MIKEQIMQIVENTPEFSQGMDMIEQQLERMPIVPEDMDEAIAMLEFVLQNPDKYQEVREAAIKDGLIQPQMVPEEFDQAFIISLLATLYAAQDRLAEKGFKRGGLTVAARKLQTGGRGGDTELVHVNAREREMLRRMGGSGEVNPNTGLREYKSFKKVLGTVLPIALAFVPGVNVAVGGFLSGGALAGASAAALGGAAIGAAGSALSGGNVLQGAALGGLGGYMGAAGNAANPAMASGSGGMASLADEAAMTATGSAGLQAPQFTGYGLTPASAGQVAGEAALKAGATTQLAPGLSALASMSSPADSVLRQMTSANTATDYGLPTQGGVGLKVGAREGLQAPAPQSAQPSAVQGGNVFKNALTKFTEGPNKMGNLLMAGSLANSLMSAPPQIQTAIGKLSPQQQEYFNRPSIEWDWNKIQQDAAAQGMDVSDYMARNWNTITTGVYDKPKMAMGGMYSGGGYANGGALNAIARFATGAGSGRDDTIDAKLSDGEYVMDAETVALLGDGSNKEGARRLDAMRSAVRSHKGKTLAKGKFSPNAKSPLAYLKGMK